MEEDQRRLEKENQTLRQRLHEAEESLEAIRKGEVDAIVVKGAKGEQIYSLLNPEHPYQIFIENMGEAAVILSKEGTILYCNPGFSEMMGEASETFIGQSLIDFVSEEYRGYFLEILQKRSKKKIEFQFLPKEGRKIHASISISKGIWGETESLCIVISDITKLKRTQEMVIVSESITKILSETTTLSQALKLVVGVLKTYLDWDVITLWLWNKESQTLNCLEIAHVPGIEIETFEKKTRETSIDKTSMPNRILSSYRPIWIEDVCEDYTFLRRKEAQKDNLHGAVAFPFYEKTELAGVVELFRKTPFKEEVDDPFLNLITSIGIEIGQFIQRKSIEEEKYQFATMVRYSVNGIYSTDRNGIVKSWNPSAERIYGWTAQEMISTNIKKIYPEDRKHEYDEIWSALIAGKSLEHFETQRVRKDGTPIWVQSAHGPILNSLGEVIGACVVVQDVSAQKTVAQALEKSEERFRAFVETTQEWIWEIDAKGEIVFSNQAVEAILGYALAEIVGKSIFLFIDREDLQRAEKQFQANVAQKKGWARLVFHFCNRDGTDRWLESSASEILGANRELLGFRGASRDMTESKNLERIKNEFISISSHEIRTPLTSIQGALTLLATRKLSQGEKDELIATAQRNSEKLTGIVNDMMDVEQFQLGRISFAFKKIDIKQIVEESIRTAKIIAQKTGIQIIANEPLPSFEVNADERRLVQLMLNLLTNAIKFSPPQSSVFISVEPKGNSVRVSVRDQGPGIPKEFEPKLFNRFTQADSSAKRTFQGTGLGLYICKNIVEGHGGMISYESKLGEGSVFYFELPRAT